MQIALKNKRFQGYFSFYTEGLITYKSNAFLKHSFKDFKNYGRNIA